MSQVTIKPSESGALITPYKNNPQYGYVTVQSEQIVMNAGWIRTVSRTALLRAETTILDKFVAMNGNKPLPGHIVVKEYLESELPASFETRLNKNASSREEAIAPFIKRAGKEGIELTLGGERILRFTDYDATGNDTDIIVNHDNVEEVSEARKAQQSTQGASFPQ